jgi:hypothetical protein
MKYLAIVLAMTLMINLHAQTVREERASHKIIKKFIAQKYPSAKSVWILGQMHGYRTVFKTSEGKFVSSFSLNNDWVKTEKKIKPKDLPDSVMQAFRKSKFSSASILETERVEFPDQSKQLNLIVARYQHTENDEDKTELCRLYYTDSGTLTKYESLPETILYSRPFDEH